MQSTHAHGRTYALDIIGDVHGALDPLRRLGRALGYNVDADWEHPEGRMPVFLGDLVDRGPHSLEVAALVQRLHAMRRAHCLMGNHEYNLLDWRLLGNKSRSSNRATCDAIERDPDVWEPIIAFFARLPLAFEIPGLRIIHASWHTTCVERLRPLLGPAAGEPNGDRTESAWSWLHSHVALRSPFAGGSLVPGLPAWGVDGSHDTCHEVLIKGFESAAHGPIVDAEGLPRDLSRVRWWLETSPDVATDVPVVFGHYWNLPPNEDPPSVAPPHVIGSAEETTWRRQRAGAVAESGSLAVDPQTRFVCVDYNGFAKATRRGCIGAYRWPEHAVAWST